MVLLGQAKTVDELKRMIETTPPLIGKTDAPPRPEVANKFAARYLVSATSFTRARTVAEIYQLCRFVVQTRLRSRPHCS
jgi:hypothetical protein